MTISCADGDRPNETKRPIHPIHSVPDFRKTSESGSVGFYIVQFLTGLAEASNLFLVAAGLTLIFGVSRIVNFAHGSFYMVGAYVAYYLIAYLPTTGVSFWFSVLVAAMAVGTIGIIVEMLLLRRLYASPELFLLMATFGIVLIL